MSFIPIWRELFVDSRFATRRTRRQNSADNFVSPADNRVFSYRYARQNAYSCAYPRIALNMNFFGENDANIFRLVIDSKQSDFRFEHNAIFNRNGADRHNRQAMIRENIFAEKHSASRVDLERQRNEIRFIKIPVEKLAL